MYFVLSTLGVSSTPKSNPWTILKILLYSERHNIGGSGEIDPAKELNKNIVYPTISRYNQ